MWIIENDSWNDPVKEDKETVTNVVKPSYSIVNLDSKNFIEIDNLDSKMDTLTEKIKITWRWRIWITFII